MARHDDVGGKDLDAFEHARDEADASGQARPDPGQDLVHFPAGGRESRVDDDRLGRRVVKDEHDVREQPVACPEIENPAAAKHSPHSFADLPRLVQLLARKASRLADGAADSIEQRVGGEAREVVLSQASARGRQERHSSILSLLDSSRFSQAMAAIQSSVVEAGMPFKSQAQRRKFAQLLVEGKISNETFEEWNRETGGKKLPERVARKAAPRKKAKTKSTARTASKRRS